MDNNKPTNTGGMPPLDTSVRKLAILGNGEGAIITGRGLAVVGTQEEIDITDMPEADREYLRKNMHEVNIERKGDRISIRTAGKKTLTVQDKHKGKKDSRQWR